MSYIIRNTIALGAVLLVLIGLGAYLTILSMPKKIQKSVIVENVRWKFSGLLQGQRLTSNKRVSHAL